MSADETPPETADAPEDGPEKAPSREGSQKGENTPAADDEEKKQNEDSPEEPPTANDLKDEQEPEVKEEHADIKDSSADDNKELVDSKDSPADEIKEVAEADKEEKLGSKKTSEEHKEVTPPNELEKGEDEEVPEKVAVEKPSITKDVPPSKVEITSDTKKASKKSPVSWSQDANAGNEQTDPSLPSSAKKGRKSSVMDESKRHSFQENLASNKDTKQPVEDASLALNLRRSKAGSQIPGRTSRGGSQDRLWVYAFIYVLLTTFLMRYVMCSFKFFILVIYTILVVLLALKYYDMGPLARGFSLRRMF